MTPYELQIEVLRGYMRFYSLRQWAKYFFTFRFTKLLFQSWGWWIVRTWRKNKANQAFMKSLQKLPRPQPSRSPRGSERDRRCTHDRGCDAAAGATSAGDRRVVSRRAPTIW